MEPPCYGRLSLFQPPGYPPVTVEGKKDGRETKLAFNAQSPALKNPHAVRLAFVRPLHIGEDQLRCARELPFPERVWAISIARLPALPLLHLRPINVIVSDGPCVEILS